MSCVVCVIGCSEADLENIEDAGMSPASEELDPSTLRPFGRYNVNWYNMRIEKLVNEGRVCIFCTLCIVTFSQVFNS